jgi:hypothetical protein
MKMTEQFVKARIAAAVKEDGVDRGWSEPPILRWDNVLGLGAMNEEGRKTLQAMKVDREMSVHPKEALLMLVDAPQATLVFMANLHRFWDEIRFDPEVVQAIWNLRDQFKRNRRTLVMTMPFCALPSELRHDVVVLDEPLPDADQLKTIVKKLHKSASLKLPAKRKLDHVISGLASLSAFEAEQVTSMSLSKDGLDHAILMERQRKQIELTGGLTVHRGGEKFEGLIGLDALVGFIRKVINGKMRPNVFVFIDEIEKLMAGAFGGAQDSSGTTQEQLGYILQHMENVRAQGILLVGPAGTGKSAIAKAAGSEGECWTINYDIGAQKGGIVGQTGELTRAGLKAVERIGQGKEFWIATCNRIDSLPPELRRRFRSGTWFVDIPSGSAQTAIWKMYCDRHGVSQEQPIPECEGWTGAEIETAVENAANMEVSLIDGARYISPVIRSSAESIDKLRTLASNRFLSASTGGFYEYIKHDLPDHLRALTLDASGKITDLGSMKES